MRYKLLIITLLVLVGIGVFGVYLFTKPEVNTDLPDANVVDEARKAECEQYLIVATFPDNGAVEAFMEACLRGDPVLPGELPDSLPNDDTTTGPPTDNGQGVIDGCMTGGCSGQICTEASEADDLVSTCEWRNEYACYILTRCERQSDGKCGWTETSEFNQCLKSSASGPSQ